MRSVQTRRQYKIVGGDFSAQEPRLTAFMSQDENMLKSYQEGKDLYATIASMSFDKPYEDCLEFYPEGTEIEFEGEKVVCGYKTHLNVKGKERRSQAKSILLGLLYGRSSASIGEQINKSKEEAQKIIDKFFQAFPKVKKWIDNVYKNVKNTGYVEDWYGRRRRLPNINLPEYEIEPLVSTYSESNFNPFIICKDREDKEFLNKKNDYLERLKEVKWNSQIKKIIDEAYKDKIKIKCNSNLIAEAERQSVNSTIQGGAATLTKLAMINIDKDEELKRLGFRLLVTIHDEVLGECPEENEEQVAKRLCEVMINTSKPYMNVPMSVDSYSEKNWYISEMTAVLISEFKKLINTGIPESDALKIIYENHTELLPENIYKTLIKNKVLVI